MKKSYKWTLVVILALLVVVALALVACDLNDDSGRQHSVTFQADGKVVDVVNFVEGDKTIDEPAVPQKEHYTGEWESYTLADADITVQAVYTPIEYKITFVGNGQQEEYTYTAETLNEVVAPDVPAKEHYTGVWQYYELQFEENQIVNAVYTPVEYMATFDDGTTQTTVTYTVETVDRVDIPQVTPKQYYDGYWQRYQFDFTNEQVIHAEYSPTEYKITFAGNGRREVRTYTVETKDNVTAPQVPTKNHYTGVWQEYELQFDNNQVVNAVYTPIEYKITFVGNGQRIERTYNAETTSQFVAPDVPAKEYYGFECAGKWEQFYFKYDDQQVVNAVYEVITPGYTYTLNSDKQSYSLANVSKDIENAIVLPFYNDLPVTSIGERAFSYCTNLQTVTFEGDSKLQSIGYRAFYGRSSLTFITIPSTITSIGSSAFYNCSSLQTVTFEGDSQLQSVGEEAFYGCISLTNVYYGGTIESWCRIEFMHDDYSIASNPLCYGCRFFMRQDEDWQEVSGEIEIPESVEVIGDYQFMCFSKITSIIIPSTVMSIGECAFLGCDRLTNVYYGGTIESWCEIEFMHDDYSSDSSNPMYYANHFFVKQGDDWREVTEINIPEGVEKIGDYQFCGFTNVTSITIPSTVTNIGGYAFEYCNSLSNIYYCGTIESWCSIELKSSPMGGVCHFFMKQDDDWQEVTKIVIPDGVETIGNNQFYGFENITSITIPSTVTSIGINAFGECSNLTSITIPNTIISISAYAFHNCTQLTNVYYGGTIESWCKIEFINDWGWYEIEAISNPMYYADHFFMKQGGDWQEVTEINIPESVEEIGSYQFFGFDNLISITIPSTVISIGYYAFYDCDNLQAVTFEGDSQLRIIGDYAFYKCAQLQTITFEGDNQLRIIGDSAFYGCSSLMSIIIPSTVTSIGYKAFNGCFNLTIYCEVAKQPSSWDNNWNPDNCPVVWDYKNQ